MQYTLYKKNGTYSLLLASSRTEPPISLEDITRNLAAARTIANIFAENLVLPCHAAEIMDDLLGSGEFL